MVTPCKVRGHGHLGFERIFFLNADIPYKECGAFRAQNTPQPFRERAIQTGCWSQTASSFRQPGQPCAKGRLRLTTSFFHAPG